jgi:hypothetical protein
MSETGHKLLPMSSSLYLTAVDTGSTGFFVGITTSRGSWSGLLAWLDRRDNK